MKKLLTLLIGISLFSLFSCFAGSEEMVPEVTVKEERPVVAVEEKKTDSKETTLENDNHQESEEDVAMTDDDDDCDDDDDDDDDFDPEAFSKFAELLKKDIGDSSEKEV